MIGAFPTLVARSSPSRRTGETKAWLARFALVSALLPLPAQAADLTSPAAETRALVIYPGQASSPNNGLALIVERRTLELPAGPSVIQFRGVADTLVPQTAEVDGLPAPAAERDFDYDLLSPGSLLKRGIDQPVQLIRTNPKTGRATATPAVIRSAPDGVALQTAQGVEALHCSGAPERIVFDRTPPGLFDRPTLSLRVVSPSAGRRTLTLRYLATGFGWRANYVARVRPDGKTLDLTAWLTLQNASGETIAEAPTEVIAGRLGLTGEDRPVDAPVVLTQPDCWNVESWALRMRNVMPPAPPPPPPPPAPGMAAPMAMMRSAQSVQEVVVTGSKKMAEQGELGDYKLYRLPEPTTVAARQTKQVGFLDQAAVPFETVYSYEVQASGGRIADGDPATRLDLKLENRTERGLGKPLPRGAAAVSAPGPGGRPLLIGEARVEDTPVGLPWRLKLGPAYAVQVALKVTRFVPAAPGRRAETTVEVALTNARDEPATVELRHAAEPGAWTVASEDSVHTVEGGVPQWTVRLAAGERRLFHYSIQAPN